MYFYTVTSRVMARVTMSPWWQSYQCEQETLWAEGKKQLHNFPTMVSSHLISSHLISSHLISSHLISSCLISSHLILSGLILNPLWQCGWDALQRAVSGGNLPSRVHTCLYRKQPLSTRPPCTTCDLYKWPIWGSAANSHAFWTRVDCLHSSIGTHKRTLLHQCASFTHATALHLLGSVDTEQQVMSRGIQLIILTVHHLGKEKLGGGWLPSPCTTWAKRS